MQEGRHGSGQAGGKCDIEQVHLPILDEGYLKADAQFGGVDQRKIFALAKEVLPRVGFRERAHLMNPMVLVYKARKTKIDLLGTADAVRKKLGKVYTPPLETEGSGILSSTEFVLLPAGF